MATVHPTSIISKDCEIGEGVVIGPWCVISGRVKLGAGVRLIGNVYLNGPLTVGAGTAIYPFCSIGFAAQHLKVKEGDPTAGVVIGENSTLREHVTIHSATHEAHATTVGDRCLLMVNSHLGHDVKIGNEVVLVNNAALGGHSSVGDNATLGGGALLHQFTRVGRMAFIGGGTRAVADIPPFTSAVERSRLAGINLIGLRRAGIPRDQITLVREAFRKAFREPMTRPEILETLTRMGSRCPLVAEMAAFVGSGANRPISVGYDRGERDEAGVI